VRFQIESRPEGRRYELTGYTVGACNSQSYGGGMRAAPDALLDDGALDVIVLEDVSKLRFLTRILPKVFSGAHLREACVKSFRATEVDISADRPLTVYADGEEIADLPARVRVLPGAVSVIVPAGDQPSSAFARVGAAAPAPDGEAGSAAAAGAGT
jgi:diacylglycerol kinase family enzyme